MADEIRGVPIGDLPDLGSVPDDSLLVTEFLGKAYSIPGAVIRELIQDVITDMGGSIDNVTETQLTKAIETVLASGRYNGVSPLVEVTEDQDGTSVLHVVDAFGIKDYPVEVKGARNAVQYTPQTLTEEQKAQARENIGVAAGGGGSSVVVELFATYNEFGHPDQYLVLLNGELITGDLLDEMAKAGTIVIAIAKDLVPIPTVTGNLQRLDIGTVLRYDNAVVFQENGTHSFEFSVRVDDQDFAVAYQDGKWKAKSQPVHLTFLLSDDNGTPVVFYNGETLAAWKLYELLMYYTDITRPVFCYQDGMRFPPFEDFDNMPPRRTQFSLKRAEEDYNPFYYFYAEHDGYNYSLKVKPSGYVCEATKGTAYRTAESKADDLSFDENEGTISLMSDGEPISDPVPISGPRGPQGPPGPQGESGVAAPINGFFTLSVDENGDLWVYSEEETSLDFEYDPESGNLYVVQEQ